MPDIASALKEEIARVARKEVRKETEQLKKASAQHRTQIAALKRQIQAMEQKIKRFGKGVPRTAGSTAAKDEQAEQTVRFSAKGFALQRKRLGLSAAQMGLLLGTSGQSVYKWEDGKARPRARQLPGIASLRKLGKKEAAARLEALANESAAETA